MRGSNSGLNNSRSNKTLNQAIELGHYELYFPQSIPRAAFGQCLQGWSSSKLHWRPVCLPSRCLRNSLVCLSCRYQGVWESASRNSAGSETLRGFSILGTWQPIVVLTGGLIGPSTSVRTKHCWQMWKLGNFKGIHTQSRTRHINPW